MKKAHIVDGVALTKFIYWIKNINKKKITEVDAQNKLEKFRKKNKNFLYPSFDTIAGSGKNGAIVHYRANKERCRTITNKDIFLCDSGGQYKYGTTDVTRTICFSKPKNYIRNIFTYVLKGHIAVATTNLKKDNIGKKIDFRARKYLKQNNLDYAHGTGHGVGFFLNVHEGPQSISKINKIKIKEGMILSNEPGYYKKDKFGIRIENLVYVKKIKNKTFFENLTLVPIEKDLINPKLLNLSEKNYLFKYHLNVYSKISKFLDIKEKKWLASFI
jgi:Xaa-Pro aminopeptidase